jgi:hypothetical protein
MTIQVHAECLRLDDAGQKTSDRRIAMTFSVAENFCSPYTIMFTFILKLPITTLMTI